MKIEIISEDKEKGTAVVKLADIHTAESKITTLESEKDGLFNTGYGKGEETGRKRATSELLTKLDFLGLDSSKLDDSITQFKTTFAGLKKGKLDENEEIETLRTQLREKSTAFETLQNNHKKFMHDTLIDGKLKDLAAKHNAVNPLQIPVLFKNDFKIELDDKNNIIIKDPVKDRPVYDPKTGDPLDMNAIFENQFKTANPHLFKANGDGGSGGGDGGDGDFSHIKKYSDFKNVSEKLAYEKKHGPGSLQKLMDKIE